jgi:glycosyltransferase involved in cell wall biosynthesis
MKASILLATYNKNDCLRNALYSIVQQRAPFDFEVCIVDDVSEEDPLPIIREMFNGSGVTYIYERLEEHVGGQFSQSHCMELMSPDSTMGIVQSCDVMYLQDDLLERLCKPVRPGFFSMAGVKNVSIDFDAHLHYNKVVEGIESIWDSVRGSNIYSGIERPGGDWLLFLGAMTREDLLRIDFDYRCCDVVVQQKMREQGLKPVFLDDVRAVHQQHPPAHLWPCSIVDSCEYWCRRKQL